MEIDIKKVMSLDLYKILDIEDDASDSDVSNVRTRGRHVKGETAKLTTCKVRN